MFWRAIKRLSDQQLDALEAEMIEDAVKQFRRRPGFAINTEAQRRVATYEYELRCLKDIEAARAAPRVIPRRRYIPPAEPVAPQPSPPATYSDPTRTDLLGDEMNAPLASTKAPVKPAALPDNVVPLRPYFGPKAFGIGGETYWVGHNGEN